jgi:hypothetical protein
MGLLSAHPSAASSARRFSTASWADSGAEPNGVSRFHPVIVGSIYFAVTGFAFLDGAHGTLGNCAGQLPIQLKTAVIRTHFDLETLEELQEPCSLTLAQALKLLRLLRGAVLVPLNSLLKGTRAAIVEKRVAIR